MLSATTASAASVTVLLLALCGGTDARLNVSSFDTRRLPTCYPDPLSFRLEDRASCPFTRTENMQASRIPAVVPTVTCNCPGRQCSRVGDFRCQEIRETLQVAYVGGGGPALFRNETFTVACACVTSRARSGTPTAPRVGCTTPQCDRAAPGLGRENATSPQSELRKRE
ncbi:uncharacterized protein LOC142558087 [Dermacentor variabilis]|uniref:uncharacterized protein LOC142558087 n=1 Tax=Dermacentor variabilis TaxID=34621 RepID=UPI003F5B8CBD